MASVPRAARKGKAAAAVTPQGAGTSTTPPTVASPGTKLPEADSKSPAGASDPSPGSVTTPSFLSQGSLLQLNNEATSHVAMGVVRGRGQAQLASDREIVAKSEDVAAAVTSALKGSLSASAAAAPKPAALPTTKKSSVFLVKQANLLQRASLLSQAGDNVVLYVTPHPTDVETAELEGLGKDQFSSWYGNISNVKSSSKLVLTDLSTLQLHLNSTKSLKPFTHVVFSHTGSSVLLYQSVFFMVREFLGAGGKKNQDSKPKIYIATYADGQDISLKAYFDKYNVEAEGTTTAGKHDVKKFTADESAAFCGIAAVKPGRLVEDRTSAGVIVIPQPKVMDRVAQQALGIIKKLVTGNSGLRIIVFTAEAAQLQSAFQKELPENTEVAVAIDAFDVGSKKNQVAFDTKLSSTINAAALDVHCVIDTGLERAVHIASKAEQMLPSKRPQWCAEEVCVARKRVLGQVRPGLYFSLLAEEDSQYGGKMIADPTPLCSADHALLQLSRFLGTESVNLMQGGPTRPTQDAMESALIHLDEKNAIASSQNPEITFLGEVMARSGLNLDLANFMVHGLIAGMPQLFAITAAVIVAPLRQSPKSSDPKAQEAWLAKASEQMKAAGRSWNSDVLADVMSYLKLVEDTKAAEAEGVDVANITRITQISDMIQQRLKDFVVPNGPQAAATLLQLVEQRHNELEFILAASLARNALSVRSEGAITGKPATGNLLFMRTTKEVQGNAYVPTTMSWRSGTVVVPTNLNNTAHKIYAQGGSLIAQNYFFTALVLLAPTLEYSSPMKHKGEEVICFSVTVNRNAKRFYTDVGTAARIMEFREQWNSLLGAVQIKRSLPNKASRLQVLSTLQSKDAKFDLEATRTKALDEFSQLVHSCEMREYQSVFEPHGQHRTAPNTEIRVEKIAAASDVILSEALAAGNFNAADDTEAAPAKSAEAAAPAAEGLGNGVVVEEDDDIEVEGTGFFAAGAVIEEEDDD